MGEAGGQESGRADGRPNRLMVRIVGRADRYGDGFGGRSATRFPRYDIETVATDELPAGLPRRGSLASFNEDDDETFRVALDAGAPLEVDEFRVHWDSPDGPASPTGDAREDIAP